MKSVCVLMSTYNGEKYLRTQIDSILSQKNINLKLIIRDDGSIDNTIKILEEYKNKGMLTFYTGDNLKPAHSFMDLLYKAPQSDFYAFADQDDFWEEKKLIKAIEKMSQEESILYFSNVKVVDEKLELIEEKSLANRKNTLGASFVDSPAIGCTMVFSEELKELITSKKITNLEISMHDSWIYRITLALGKKITYDNNAYIKYRQHTNNVIGLKKNNTILKKIASLFKKKKKTRSFAAQNILDLYEKEILIENKKLLWKIGRLSVEKPKVKDKCLVLLDKKIKSNNINSNIRFIFDVLMNRL